MTGSERLFKIRLVSGRVLGPIDLDRVRELIKSNAITGAETAREYPHGDWHDINRISILAELLVLRAQGYLEGKTFAIGGEAPVPEPAIPALPSEGPTQVLPSHQSVSDLVPDTVMPRGRGEYSSPSIPRLSEPGQPPGERLELYNDFKTRTEAAPMRQGPAALTPPDLSGPRVEVEVAEDRTIVEASGSVPPLATSDDANGTMVDMSSGSLARKLFPMDGSSEIPRLETPNLQIVEFERPAAPAGQKIWSATRPNIDLPVSVPLNVEPRSIANEVTVVFAGSALPGVKSGRKKVPKSALRSGLILVMAIFAVHEVLFPEPEPPAALTQVKLPPVVPKLPGRLGPTPDPQLSAKSYAEAMKDYVKDTETGYRRAAEKLLVSAGQDGGNVKALAMLASCYLNLIDSSNKNETYFAVISKLIEMSRSKDIDLPETVIADVEFYVTANKAEAAQNRIVEYTKTHRDFGLEMFHYLAYAYYGRGDYDGAARFSSQYPDAKAFSPKVFYLRGLIAEQLKDDDSAMVQYKRALKMNPMHAKSMLKTASIYDRRGELRNAVPLLTQLITHIDLLAPKDLALAYYLYGRSLELKQDWETALAYLERAVKLDHDNHDYLFELYTLRARAGDTGQTVKDQAKMYLYLGDAEKLLKDGKVNEALSRFLEARQVNLKSPLPLAKIGDMFQRLGDMGNALLNYKMAAERAPKDVEIWSKYISALILNFEWDEAQKAMVKFRALPVSQSSIDKVAGDLYSRQGKHLEAQMYYKKAMAAESIDPQVYIAYAKSLMATKNFKDAPFFFALALRYDPLNSEAIIGIAKSVATTESIERGISLLQDELQKSQASRAEYLAAIADMQIQRGEWALAQQYVDQARVADPDYGYPWKIQAQIDLNQEGLDKKALPKALDAYKSFSDRMTSDPSGYLARYQIFTRKGEFEKAGEELARIYALYPKYPNLHYYKGALYSVMGNTKLAIAELREELKNNPNSVTPLIALGKVYIDVGAPRDALDQFVRAMQLAPNQAEPKHQAGYANYLLKNFAGAVALYQAALGLDHGNPLIYKRLGLVYREIGDLTNARIAFKRYLEMEPDAADKAEFERFL